MRAFIAIDLPKDIKDRLRELQRQLNQANADVKWVSPENIHLTLKFLGEVDEDTSAQICAALDSLTLRHSAYHARLSSLGGFPSLSSLRVTWVAIDEGDNQTKAIAQDLEEALGKIGFEKEGRPFTSHITLGRVRSGLNRNKLARLLTELGKVLTEEHCGFKVETITLFKSILSPQGPRYEILKTANLKPI